MSEADHEPTAIAEAPAPDDEASDTLLLTAEQKASVKVLLVDDDESLCESCGNLLEHEGYDILVKTRGEEARTILKRRRFDIVLLDLYMRQVSGFELLETILGAYPDTIVLVMTGKPSVDSSLRALRAGAWDYLPKPFSATHLQVLVGRAAHTIIVARESHELNDARERRHGTSDQMTLLGGSHAFKKAVEKAARVASTDASVFLTGESGTGKEMFAQFIHTHSRRSSRPMVAVNCAALPEQLLESEMFGHVKGAFTGAVRDKPGLLEQANGGTLFLDELTEMPPTVQAKLLRVIQDGMVRRLGSNGTDAVVNVRFIAATNRDADEAVASGHLREDLFYRLRVVPIKIPPLRERPSDVSVLARHFLALYWNKHRSNGEPAPSFTDEALQALQKRPWPGNVRELQNLIEHAVVLVEAGTPIGPREIPDLDGDPTPVDPTEYTVTNGAVVDRGYHEARERVLADFERRYLEWVVQAAGGNMSEAARIASVDRTTLYRLMDKHAVNRDLLLT